MSDYYECMYDSEDILNRQADMYARAEYQGTHNVYMNFGDFIIIPRTCLRGSQPCVHCARNKKYTAENLGFLLVLLGVWKP